MRGPFTTALRLPVADQLTSVRVILTGLVVELAIRRMGLPRLAEGLGLTPVWSMATVAPPLRSLSDFEPPLVPRERRQVRAVLRVMRHWPFGSGSCLRQALVLGHLLRARGPHLRIGVRAGDGGVDAHAWVEVSGLAVDDQGFAPLLRATSAGTAA